MNGTQKAWLRHFVPIIAKLFTSVKRALCANGASVNKIECNWFSSVTSFCFGLHFLVSHIQEFSSTDVGLYFGVAAGLLISVTGLLKPYVYIKVYKGLGVITDIGGLLQYLSRWHITKQ